jgi:cytochrome oxidase Cu insertion factor (SCO1/SenC/PrrC family)
MVATVALAAVLAAAWLAGIDRDSQSQARLLPDQVMTVLAEPKPLTDFALTDDRNRPFGPESLKGKWSFLFFGFTYCPDVGSSCRDTDLSRGHVRQDGPGRSRDRSRRRSAGLDTSEGQH